LGHVLMVNLQPLSRKPYRTLPVQVRERSLLRNQGDSPLADSCLRAKSYAVAFDSQLIWIKDGRDSRC
jgi:hypothetical protein